MYDYQSMTACAVLMDGSRSESPALLPKESILEGCDARPQWWQARSRLVSGSTEQQIPQQRSAQALAGVQLHAQRPCQGQRCPAVLRLPET